MWQKTQNYNGLNNVYFLKWKKSGGGLSKAGIATQKIIKNSGAF